MITVTLFKTDGKFSKVRSVGHSGLADRGNDILCAAVSALVQTAYLAITDKYGNTQCVKRDGLFEFFVPYGADSNDAQVIIGAMCVGLKDLSSGYPQNLKMEEA